MVKNYLKKTANYLLNKTAGKKELQRFFERLHQISLSGMNFNNIDISSNGEKTVIEYLKLHIKKGADPVVFDVGANVGDYSKEIFSVLGNAKIYCFEPSKKAFGLLKENLKNCKNAKLYNFGFGEENKNTVIYSNEEGSVFGSLYARKLEHHGIKMDQQENVVIRRLDDFCAENNVGHINLLKMDVEGNELKVLKGAEKTVKSGAVDFMQFEFGGCNIDSGAFFRDFFYFLNPDYKIYRILKNGLFLIDKYDERYEIFMAINYLAMSRKL